MVMRFTNFINSVSSDCSCHVSPNVMAPRPSFSICAFLKKPMCSYIIHTNYITGECPKEESLLFVLSIYGQIILMNISYTPKVGLLLNVFRKGTTQETNACTFNAIRNTVLNIRPVTQVESGRSASGRLSPNLALMIRLSLITSSPS